MNADKMAIDVFQLGQLIHFMIYNDFFIQGSVLQSNPYSTHLNGIMKQCLSPVEDRPSINEIVSALLNKDVL